VVDECIDRDLRHNIGYTAVVIGMKVRGQQIVDPFETRSANRRNNALRIAASI